MSIGGRGYKDLFKHAANKQEHGYWGNHGDNKGGCWGYLIMLGIIIAGALYVILFR